MAPRKGNTSGGGTPAPDASGTPAPDASTPQADATKATFDWGTLDAPHAMATKQSTPGTIKVKVLETVPEPIRQRAEQSLTINTERVKAVANSTAKRPRIDYHWDLQPVPDTETGDKFVKLVTKYAKYRPADQEIPHAGPASPKGQVTARCGNVGHYRKVSDGEYVACADTAEGAFMGVRYSVRPHEQRTTTARLPGTA
jgi:hypothetical protein